jgi:hypothetical protein
VSALGVVSGAVNVSLARQAAMERALRRLAGMLRPEALRFRYSVAGPDASFTTELLGARVHGAETSYEELARGCLARATVDRPEETMRAIDRLTGITSAGQSAHADPSLALLLAENQAFREAVAKVAPQGADHVAIAGSITVLSQRATVTDAGASVSLELSIKISATRPLSTEEAAAVHDAVAARHLRANDYVAAIGSLERQVALAPDNLGLWMQIGRTAQIATLPQKALAAFEQIVERAPHRTDALRLALEAAQAIPDPAKAAALSLRIKKAEKGTAKEPPEETTTPPRKGAKKRPSKKR